MMASQHETEWQSQRSLANCMRYMLDKEKLTDIIFEVGPPDCETEQIRAHKFMLSARSPVFEAMFLSGMAECSDPVAKVRIEDIDGDIFKELLYYMYSDLFSVCPESAVYLLYAAKKYMLPMLVGECVNCVVQSLRPDNVLQFFEHSFNLGHEELRSGCLKVIAINAKTILTGTEILFTSRPVLDAILKSERLSASETLVYETCVKWAERQLQSVNPGSLPTDLQIRESLGDLLFLIRFPSLKVYEFAKVAPSGSQVLSVNEKESIYYFITTKLGNELKFPKDPRCGIDFYVNRSTGTCKTKWQVPPCFDAIDFIFDKDILLRGFKLCTAHDGRGYEADVEILMSSQSLFKERYSVPFSETKSQKKFKLAEAIFLRREIRYTITTLSDGHIGFFCTDCKPVVIADTVTFSFTRHINSTLTTELVGQIPVLFGSIFDLD